uniref:DNA2/NAM7 helicase-like C-terminal domain-containing protein n=1 Tax=Timema douglasi TaxID=61478 RepID=A0A7R8VCT6_TIMDO|nr:unnamed protein product [Timema douglasi]
MASYSNRMASLVLTDSSQLTSDKSTFRNLGNSQAKLSNDGHDVVRGVPAQLPNDLGDHQQLRPTTADFTLARKYNFDISLFERMLKNGMHCELLKVQHRMRPEIAKMIVPAIYPELFNHESVLGFDNIMGISKSVFFVTHNHYEEKVEDSASHRNIYEADYVLALCRHLLMQGYPPDKITILTTYSRQMFHLKSVTRSLISHFQDTRAMGATYLTARSLISHFQDTRAMGATYLTARSLISHFQDTRAMDVTYLTARSLISHFQETRAMGVTYITHITPTRD